MPQENANELKPVATRRWKWLRRGVIALFAVALVGLGAVNLFLATPKGRSFVGGKVSAAMRLPVTVGSSSYTPWGGVRLKDLRVEQVAAAGAIVDDPFFSATSFSADVRLLSLLTDEVVIERLVCDSPTLSIVRGQQVIRQVQPQIVKNTEPKKEVVSEEVKVEPEAGASSSPRTRTPRESGRERVIAKKKKRRTVSLGEVEIRGGTLVMTTLDGSETLRVEGLKMVVDLSKGSSEEKIGRVSFERAMLLDALEVTEFSSPMQMKGRRIKMTGLSANCEGGSIEGDLLIEPRRQQTQFLTTLSAVGIEVASMLEGKFAGVKSGKVSAELALRGDANRLSGIEGNGAIRLESAVLAPEGEFGKLRRAMEVDKNGNVKIDPAEAKFAVRGGVLGLQEASFGSGQVLIKSVGGVRFDGKLNLAVRLYLGRDLYSGIRSQPLPGVNRSPLEFLQLEGTDWFYRDELLGGNVRNPMVDFWRTGEPVSAWDVVKDLSFDFDEQAAGAIGR